ncbi:MAG: hypothetical protein ACREJ3_09030, partial [Polyangiaceae bacterium]
MTSPGQIERESLYVDADSWQKALQVARVRRGDDDSLTGFSIELLEIGCKAVDPTTYLNYLVKPAGDRASQAPPPLVIPAGAPAAPVTPAGAHVNAEPSAPHHSNMSPTVPSQIIFKREQDATASMPLTYREYVYAIAPGSSESAAEGLIQMQLRHVQSSLERARPGKLVNLAVFDTTFQGKPPTLPLVTLAWKDWRGAPVLSFPRRPIAQHALSEPAQGPPPAPPHATASVFPPETAVHIANHTPGPATSPSRAPVPPHAQPPMT